MYEKRFDGKGEIYARFRPTYPKAMLDYLYTKGGMHAGSVIADVGAGTGILTRLLLERGCTVFVVEPNADMRRKAEETLRSFAACHFTCGNAEQTLLPDHSVHFVMAAQAFHWFDRGKFKNECMRILKRNGKIVLIWNCRDETSALVQENERINRQYCPQFRGFSGGMGTPAQREHVLQEFFESPYDIQIFDNPLTFHEDDFLGRNFSSSYAPDTASETGQAYETALKALFQKYSQAGTLLVPNHTYCYIGTV